MNRADLTPKADQQIDLLAVPAAIRNAGFTPAEMHLVATGTFVGVPPNVRFQIRGWPSELPVRVTGPSPVGEQRISARVEYADSLVLVVEAPVP